MVELVERPRITRISWGGVFAGLFSGFGIWLLLSLLGDAIGFSAAKGSVGQSWLDLFLGLSIWAGIATILAAFCGAWIAARVSASGRGVIGLLHGVTLWGFASLLTAYGAFIIVGSMVRTAATTAGTVAGAATSAVGNVVGKAASQVPGALNSDALTGQVNQYLASKSLPPVEPQQLRSSIDELVHRTIAKGGLSQQEISQVVSQNTQLSPQQVDAVSSELSTKLRDVRGQAKQVLSSVGQQAGNIAQQVGSGVQQVSAKTLWGLLIVSLLSLGAAAFGGLLGSIAFRRGERLVIERPIETPPRQPPLRPREA